MEELSAWGVIGEVYFITIVVSFVVAFLIHMMTILISRFGAAKPGVVSNGQIEAKTPADNPEEMAAVAIAIAMRGDTNKGR